jgi:hypothetical protein
VERNFKAGQNPPSVAVQVKEEEGEEGGGGEEEEERKK